jgi:hypothetical protein
MRSDLCLRPLSTPRCLHCEDIEGRTLLGSANGLAQDIGEMILTMARMEVILISFLFFHLFTFFSPGYSASSRIVPLLFSH